MLPLLLRPRVLSVKNRWLRPAGHERQRGRDIVIGLFSIMIMFSIFNAVTSLLSSMHAQPAALIHPSVLLGLFFAMLFAMLLFSYSVAALGALFLAKDLDLVLASPLNPFPFFLGKSLQVVVTASWMVVVFGLPLVVAFGRFFGMSWVFYLYCVLLLAPFFAIPVALAQIGITLITRFVPVRRTRTVLVGLSVLLLAGVYMLVHVFSAPPARMGDFDELLQMLTLLSLPHQRWLPSHWLAVCLGQALQPMAAPSGWYAALLFSTAAGLSAAAFLTLRSLHLRAYSQAAHSEHRTTMKGRRLRHGRRFRFGIRPHFTALMAKELKCFTRDFGQALQMLLLIAICFIYLYNFRFLRAGTELPGAVQIWWRGLLAVANVAMGSFVITAVCTRFVYPSVSLEGSAFWVLTAAPLPLRDILRAKFRFWQLPVSLIGLVIFVSGALAIDASPAVIGGSAVVSAALAYGVTGLGVGLGALFADFDWESPAQLSASMGSLLYMLSSLALAALNLVPVCLLMFLGTAKHLGSSLTQAEWYVFAACSTGFLFYINFAAVRWALNAGEQALLKRQRG